MIDITHIKWSEKKIGIALRKLKPGLNQFVITAKDKNGDYLYPGIFTIHREEAIQKYGLAVINKRNLTGIWIPLEDLERSGDVQEVRD